MKELLKFISDNILILSPAFIAVGSFFRWLFLGWSKNKRDKISIKIETNKLILQNMDEITKDLSDAYKSISNDKRIINFMFSNCKGCMDKVKEKYPEYFDEK